MGFKLKLTCLLLSASLVSVNSIAATADRDTNSMLDLATKGFVEAQHFVGEMYFLGKGAPKDFQAALYWFERAAEQGQPYSAYFAGIIYQQEESFESQMLALNRFEQSARAGFAHAQFQLGQMIHQGKFVEPDYDEALAWFTLAAEQGLAKAQYNTGLMYYKGLGTEKDNQTALYWLSEACEKSFKKSCQAVTDLEQRIEYGEPSHELQP